MLKYLFAATILAAPAQAAVVIDQTNFADLTRGWINSSSIAAPSPNLPVAQTQTVTAGRTGLLTRVDLQAGGFPGQTGNFDLSIYDGDYAAANAKLVFASSFAVTDAPLRSQLRTGALFTVDLASAGFHLVQGQVFTIRLSTGTGSFDVDYPVLSWVNGVAFLDELDEFGMPRLELLAYADGSATVTFADGLTVNATADRAFRTWVDTGVAAAVPEPATWAMMIAGFGLVGMAARRRHPATA